MMLTNDEYMVAYSTLLQEQMPIEVQNNKGHTKKVTKNKGTTKCKFLTPGR